MLRLFIPLESESRGGDKVVERIRVTKVSGGNLSVDLIQQDGSVETKTCPVDTKFRIMRSDDSGGSNSMSFDGHRSELSISFPSNFFKEVLDTFFITADDVSWIAINDCMDRNTLHGKTVKHIHIVSTTKTLMKQYVNVNGYTEVTCDGKDAHEVVKQLLRSGVYKLVVESAIMAGFLVTYFDELVGMDFIVTYENK